MSRIDSPIACAPAAQAEQTEDRRAFGAGDHRDDRGGDVRLAPEKSQEVVSSLAGEGADVPAPAPGAAAGRAPVGEHGEELFHAGVLPVGADRDADSRPVLDLAEPRSGARLGGGDSHHPDAPGGQLVQPLLGALRPLRDPGVLDLAADLAGELRGVEMGEEIDARAGLPGRLEGGGQVGAEGGHHPVARDDHAPS